MRDIFLSAIETGEELNSLIDEEKQFILKEAIQEKQLNTEAAFLHQASIKPMFNLIQYYIHNEPFEKMRIMFWLSTLLKLSQIH